MNFLSITEERPMIFGHHNAGKYYLVKVWGAGGGMDLCFKHRVEIGDGEDKYTEIGEGYGLTARGLVDGSLLASVDNIIATHMREERKKELMQEIKAKQKCIADRKKDKFRIALKLLDFKSAYENRPSYMLINDCLVLREMIALEKNQQIYGNLLIKCASALTDQYVD